MRLHCCTTCVEHGLPIKQLELSSLLTNPIVQGHLNIK